MRNPHSRRENCSAMLRLVLVLVALLFGNLSESKAADGDGCPVDRPRRAEVAAVRGDVLLFRGAADAVQLSLASAICLDDRIVTGADGAIEIRFVDSDTTISGHSDTIIHIPAGADADASILGGLMRFVSSVRGKFSIRTPHQDGGIEGTEALIRVDRDEGDSIILVREGVVRATATGAGPGLSLSAGQASYAAAGAAPLLATPDTVPARFRELLLKPDNASDWAIYYPPILFAAAATAPEVQAAAAALGRGDVDGAVALLSAVLAARPGDASARSLMAIVQIFQNDTAAGAASADQAVADDPNLAVALIAQSYARQASGDLTGALASAEAATALDPGDAYGWARAAELALSLGDRPKAEASVARSLAVQETSLGAAISGFVWLSKGDNDRAAAFYRKAIELDSFAPLPRLGLGLAFIQSGEVRAGRLEIETAVALDPNRANLRTWLARAYLAEGRGKKTDAQIDLARAADPDDPTPDLFAALSRFTANDPIGAMQAVRAAEAKGDARRVVRGRLGLAEDRATSGVALGRIYDTLGFDDAAVVAAAEAVDADPGNPGAHRFLSDIYRNRQGSEIARTSEYLKYQLLSPPSKDPVQPALAEADLGLLRAAGPSRVTFYEYSPVFDGDGVRLDLSAVAGSQDTIADQISAVAHWGNGSFGVGQLYYETDGFRANNQVEHLIFTAQGKAEIIPGLTLFAEYRRRETDAGDRSLEFDLAFDDFQTELRLDDFKAGFNAEIMPGLNALGLFRFVDATNRVTQQFNGFSLSNETMEKGFDGQAQVFLSRRAYDVVAGVSAYEVEEEFAIAPTEDERMFTGYAYVTARPSDWLDLYGGLSIDRFESATDDKTSVNPKLGFRARIAPGVVARGAYTRSVQRRQIIEERLEPTTIAGFNQLSEDSRAALSGQRTERAGLGLEVTLSQGVIAGVEGIWTDGDLIGGGDRQSAIGRAYVSAVFSDRITGTLAFEYEHEESDSQLFLQDAKTAKLSADLRYFDPRGFFGGVRGVLVDHSFDEPLAAGLESGSDTSFVFDASLGYRLPDGRGVFSLEARNLFDSNIRIQEASRRSLSGLTEQTPPEFARSRSVMLTFTTQF